MEQIMNKHIKRPISYRMGMKHKCPVFSTKNVARNLYKITKARWKREIIYINNIQILHFFH